ncbi:MAG: hypothetical protein HOH58_06370 [Opitutaceae bacterium]|jgi:hypothetical protein|nr:hypothetical protein [Opitutaceae bacterium]
MEAEVTWENLDWPTLDRIRAGFLTGSAAKGPYWQSLADLAHYDFTFAERIGWKWDHVLRELNRRGWAPAQGKLLDWGCGSGVAHRRVISTWPDSTQSVRVFDHSTWAEAYATQRVNDRFPNLDVRSWERSESIATLTISHVLNELDKESAQDLMQTIQSATKVIWVEPGTSEVAGQLVQWREKLRDSFRVVFPCPHQGACGLRTPANALHWCHHFASPPAGVFADSNWVKFGQRAGIDLRSLPYSALVLEKPTAAIETREAAVEDLAGRIIGRPKVSKPCTRFLGCDSDQVQRLEMPKKLNARLAKKLDRPNAPRLFRWKHEQGKVIAMDPLVRDDES